MKAVVLHDYGSASSLKYEDYPAPILAAGEVLVRVHAASLNPMDWMLRSGAVKEFIPIGFPYILGVDLAGLVQKVGQGVVGFEPGDRVMAMTSHTYAEFCAVKATDLVKIPDGVDMITAATLPLVNVTGDQLVRLGAKVEPGQTVLVTGALGAVGRSAVFAASEIGARVIAGVRGHKLDAARQLAGVGEAVALDDEAAIDQLAPLDCVADTIGGPIASKLLAKVKGGGAYGSVRHILEDAALFPGVQLNPIFARSDAATTLHYVEAVGDGRLTIPIDRTMPLANAAEAHAAAEKGGVAKIVLVA